MNKMEIISLFFGIWSDTSHFLIRWVRVVELGFILNNIVLYFNISPFFTPIVLLVESETFSVPTRNQHLTNHNPS